MSDTRGMEPSRLNSAAASTGRATGGYGGASGRVSNAWAASRQQATAHPLLTVIGAAAVGAGVGWLLPAGRREKDVMGEVAHKVTDVARDAADSAVEAGRQQVDEIAQNALASVGGAVVQAIVARGKSDPEPKSASS